MELPQSKQAYQAALRYLNLQERTPQQLQTYLIGKGFSTDLVEKILATALEKDWLNLERFAQHYARKCFQKAYSAVCIAERLSQFSVPAHYIATALREQPDNFMCIVAGALWTHKRIRYPSLSLEAFQPLAMRFLYRRGFTDIGTCESIWAYLLQRMQQAKGGVIRGPVNRSPTDDGV